MPALSKKDPRHYVKQVPLQIAPLETGVKIQARNETVFNPTVPERDVIRKSNYKRRQEQISSHGFRCAQHKPYIGIGDPFYLDHKKLILHALGQLEQTEQLESSASSESEDEEEKAKQQQQQQQSSTKSFTTTNFFVRRTRKDLNTIPKKHNQGRELIRNVRLGHGLFYMLRRERQQKVEAEQRQLRKRQEALRSEWQPPRRDSCSDAGSDSGQSEDEDVELNEYMQSSTMFDDTATERVGDTFLTETRPLEEPTAGAPSLAGDSLAGFITESVKPSRVAFQGTSTPFSFCVEHLDGDGGRVKSAKSTTIYTRASSAKSSGTHRRRAPSSRPYTPSHTNITRENAADIDKYALFRQLCALCWLLEAMGTENPNVMVPISQCWSMREVGGSRGKDRKQEKERLDSTWRQFITKQTSPKAEETTTLLKDPKKSSLKKKDLNGFLPNVAGRRGASRLGKSSRRYPNYPHRMVHRGSLAASQGHVSISETPTESICGLNESMNQGPTSGNTQNTLSNVRMSSAIPEGSEKGSGPEEEEEDDKGLFRFLDEYYDSLRGKESGDTQTSTADERQSNADGISVQSARSEKRPSEIAGGGRKSRLPSTSFVQENNVPEYKDLTPQEISNILESIERSYNDPRLHKLSNPTERRTSKAMRADINVRPKSSPAVMAFKQLLASNKRSTMMSELRQGFDEVEQNKALILHDTLEALEREKLRKIQNKFVHLPTKGISFHRAVEVMRSRSVAEEENLRESQRRHSIYQQWFTDLDSNIPEDIKQDWFINKVLLRLQKYGVMEANKQSAYNFIMVLSGLRDWEICSPDISAAIEFCREKIVEMSVEEYEEWFHNQFPKVVRPQTAPAICKNEERKDDKPQRRQHSAKARALKSAPPGQIRLATISGV